VTAVECNGHHRVVAFKTIIEPFRIHSVEPLRMTSPAARRRAVREAGEVLSTYVVISPGSP
jgi:hypothetical protein